jgi:hypothetical protein
MIKTATKNNYRKFYKQYYNIEFGKEMDIHHIDMNKDNNSIDNLILLPNRVHSLFHFSLNAIGGLDNINKIVNPNLSEIISVPNHSYSVNMLYVYVSSLQEIQEWICYKSLKYEYIKDERIIRL